MHAIIIDRAFQKNSICFCSLGDIPTYMILALNELMKKFLAKSTAPVFSTKASWLAYVWVDTSPYQAGSLEKIEAVDLAKKIFIY